MVSLYKKIIFPSLVDDVQKIFWDHIFPYGRLDRTNLLKNIKIDTSNPNHLPVTELMIRYPFLSNQLLVFMLPAGASTPIHMDGLGNHLTNRKISCNIPIQNCENCITEFFDAELNDFRHDIPGTVRYLKADAIATKIGEYQLLKDPVLTNTQKPHRVDNSKGLATRYSVSWTIEDTLWSAEAIEKLAKMHRHES